MPRTKMTHLPETPWMRLRRWLAIAMLLALSACGPGTGGTGTGPIDGAASFASPGSFGGGAAAPAGPCVGPCPVVHLRLEPLQVEFRQDCLRFVHAGEWSVDAAGVALVPGRIEGGSAGGAGTLRLQFEGAPQESPRVAITLFDGGGTVVVGPLSLARVADGTALPLPACP